MDKAPRTRAIPNPPVRFKPAKGVVDVMAGPEPRTTPAFKGKVFCVNQTGLRLGLNK